MTAHIVKPCRCGHSPTAHMNVDLEGMCEEPGCDCLRYVAERPGRPPASMLAHTPYERVTSPTREEPAMADWSREPCPVSVPHDPHTWDMTDGSKAGGEDSPDVTAVTCPGIRRVRPIINIDLPEPPDEVLSVERDLTGVPITKVLAEQGDTVEQLVAAGKVSPVARTVGMAQSIERLTAELTKRLAEELAADARALQHEIKAAEFDAMMANLQEQLEGVRVMREALDREFGTPRSKAASKRGVPAAATAALVAKREATKKSATTRKATGLPALYECPTCGDGFDTPQGRGAHRARKHGYRKEK